MILWDPLYQYWAFYIYMHTSGTFVSRSLDQRYFNRQANQFPMETPVEPKVYACIYNM